MAKNTEFNPINLMEEDTLEIPSYIDYEKPDPGRRTAPPEEDSEEEEYDPDEEGEERFNPFEGRTEKSPNP